MLISGKYQLSHSLFFSVAYSSLCMIEDSMGFSLNSLVYSFFSSSFNSNLGGQVGESLQVQVLMLLGHTKTENFPKLWLLLSFFTLLQCSLNRLSQVGKHFVDASIVTRLYNSAFWWVVVFCSGLQLLQREVALKKGWYYTYLWIWRQIAYGILLRLYLLEEWFL